MRGIRRHTGGHVCRLASVVDLLRSLIAGAETAALDGIGHGVLYILRVLKHHHGGFAAGIAEQVN